VRQNNGDTPQVNRDAGGRPIMTRAYAKKREIKGSFGRRKFLRAHDHDGSEVNQDKRERLTWTDVTGRCVRRQRK